MPETNNRKSKLLGGAWLVLGGLTFALVLTSLFPLVQGNTPSPFEAGDEWWIVVLVFAVVGAICMVNGLTLLGRNPVARPPADHIAANPISPGHRSCGSAFGRGAQPMAHFVKRWQEGA